MKIRQHILKVQDTSHFSYVFMLSIFSFYCFNNIFLQAKLRFHLPSTNLVTTLNNGDFLVTNPTTEKLDLYISLGKTFEAYRSDYMEHYNDYSIMLGVSLFLDESQIAMKYFTFKHYINQEYEKQDSFVVHSPIIEFNHNFYTSSQNIEKRGFNLVNRIYHIFGVKSDREACESFFDNYIFPLYKLQGDIEEVKIANSMPTILNNWELIKKLQLICFINSLLLCFITFVGFMVSSFKPHLLFKQPVAYSFLTVFLTVYSSMVILVFMCICVTMLIYTSTINFEGLNNTCYSILQLLCLLMIGYFAFCWIIRFRNNKDFENLSNNDEDDSLLQQLYEMLKISAASGENARGNGNNFFNDGISGIKSVSATPLVKSIKRLVTPKNKALSGNSNLINTNELETKTKYNLQKKTYDEPINDLNSVSFSTIEKQVNNTQESIFSNQPTIDIKQGDHKENINGFEAINLLSSSSIRKPDILPDFKVSNSLFMESNSSSATSEYSTSNKNSPGSINKDLIDKRVGFYTHNGLQVNKYVEKKSIGSSIASDKRSNSSLSNDTISTTKKLLNSTKCSGFSDKSIDDTFIQWENKLFLSGVSDESTSVDDDDDDDDDDNNDDNDDNEVITQRHNISSNDNKILVEKTSSMASQGKGVNLEPTTKQYSFMNSSPSFRNNTNNDSENGSDMLDIQRMV